MPYTAYYTFVAYPASWSTRVATHAVPLLSTRNPDNDTAFLTVKRSGGHEWLERRLQLGYSLATAQIKLRFSVKVSSCLVDKGIFLRCAR
jgi:hypothetical protein